VNLFIFSPGLLPDISPPLFSLRACGLLPLWPLFAVFDVCRCLLVTFFPPKVTVHGGAATPHFQKPARLSPAQDFLSPCAWFHSKCWPFFLACALRLSTGFYERPISIKPSLFLLCRHSCLPFPSRSAGLYPADSSSAPFADKSIVWSSVSPFVVDP